MLSPQAAQQVQSLPENQTVSQLGLWLSTAYTLSLFVILSLIVSSCSSRWHQQPFLTSHDSELLVQRLGWVGDAGGSTGG